MQFEMRKMVFLRKRRFLPANLDRIFQEWQSVIFSIHGRSSSEFLKYFFLFWKYKERPAIAVRTQAAMPCMFVC